MPDMTLLIVYKLCVETLSVKTDSHVPDQTKSGSELEDPLQMHELRTPSSDSRSRSWFAVTGFPVSL